jgi:hypothetical protein
MENNAALIICLGIVLAFAVPAVLYALSKDAGGWMRSMSKAFKRARDPWGPEDQSLQELSKLVAPFKTKGEQVSQPDLEDEGD